MNSSPSVWGDGDEKGSLAWEDVSLKETFKKESLAWEELKETFKKEPLAWEDALFAKRVHIS